jgi:eukaryotic-like serine/threonine-protein kinase
MVIAVRLTVLTGPHKNRRFCFCGPTRCQVGRALDCLVQLSGTERDLFISRHHCQLDIDPPSVQVRDLGSTNGTYVNGTAVESTLKELSEKVGSVVNHGDLLTVGGTTFRVDILDCPHAGNELEGKSIWEAGETAKKDCPLPC